MRFLKIWTTQKYGNTDFVNVLLEKLFYTRQEEVADRLGTTPDVLISNALLLTLKRLEGQGANPRRLSVFHSAARWQGPIGRLDG